MTNLKDFSFFKFEQIPWYEHLLFWLMLGDRFAMDLHNKLDPPPIKFYNI